MHVTYTNQSLTTTVTITIAPIVGRRGRFTAWQDGRLLCRSLHPICDGARALLGSGYSPDTLLIVKNLGTGITAATATIGAAARLRVNDMRFGTLGFRRWPLVPAAAPTPVSFSEFLEAAE